jgi:ADP-ribosyl-[dinitrogen reductase] hydrolase
VYYLAWRHGARPEFALSANARLGGDTVHRGAVIGAMLGAKSGMAAWSPALLDGLADNARLSAAIDGFLDAVLGRSE